MGIVIGIDIGGSTTKIVGMRDGRPIGPLAVMAGDPVTSAYGAFGKFISENGLSLSDIDKVMCTGVGSSFLKNEIYGIRTQKVDEFMAIGLGGRFSSGCENAVVVSMGTGTAIVGVKNGDIFHVCGTGVGGGTVIGLSRRLFGSSNFNHIMELALQGDVANIDLTIGDITKDSFANMNVKTTASNFGKVSESATSADLAAGVANLVFQTIGTFAMMAARAQDTRNIILTGNLSQTEVAKIILRDLEELYDVHYIVPEYSDFSTAVGAALFGGALA